MTTNNNKLTFQPFSSILNPGFWQRFTSIKLDKLKLNEDPHILHGTYSCNLVRELPCLASYDHSSFEDTQNHMNKFTCPLYGTIICMNLMQDFIDYDKKAFLTSLGEEIWSAILDGSALTDPERHLSKCGLLVYADLKRYKYYYWFSFPALNYPKDVYSAADFQESKPIIEYFSDDSLRKFQDQYDQKVPSRQFQRGYFIVCHDRNSGEVECGSLTDYSRLSEAKSPESTIYFAYTDPSADLAHPGWPLRNYLTLIAKQYKLGHVNLIRIRRGLPQSAKSTLDIHHSLVLEVTYELTVDPEGSLEQQEQCPLVTGWERNESQQIAPKRVNLESVLNPKKIAEDAVNLNLRLMKWRLMPTLDLDSIANTKCLILGCGTLGCHIARGLIAWGVKHISLVDNSKISYSNPVRQSLYTFEDCVQTMGQGGTFKAEAAAASLRRIHPTIQVFPHVLSIPMPGHHVAKDELEQTKKGVERLEELIKSHDATFLLMDTRESRWLPSVIGLSNQKLVINAAIGFDTFLLQRYGVRDYATSELEDTPSDTTTQGPSDSTSDTAARPPNKLDANQLGCYFCNDIVAPGDSTLDRTLDQQCTVSRPGVSMMVSALAVEMLASVMSSSRGSLTPAPIETQNDPSMNYDEGFGSDLGIVPHSIRGNLNRYHIYMPTSRSFNRCSACSRPVVRAYREQGFEFLNRVFDDPSHLEEIAGLKDLQNVSDDVWALDSDDAMFEDYL